jgi:hypothetical protein
MTPEAEQLLAEALRVVGLRGSFDPEELGGKIGLNKGRAEAAARALSNAGVLVLGFDNAAHFSPDYRRAKSPAEPKVKASKKAKAKDKADDAADAKPSKKDAVKKKAKSAKK